MEATKPTIRENLLRAIKLVEDEPVQLVDLDEYAKTTPCGTLHCAAGLCASDPFFQAQGMTLDGFGWLHTQPKDLPTDDLDALFGICAWQRLFNARACGTWDQGWLDPEAGHISDKELALLRLNKQLEEYPE